MGNRLTMEQHASGHTNTDFRPELVSSVHNKTFPTSFASRLCEHTPTVACRCPCVLLVETARIPRVSPANAGQRARKGGGLLHHLRSLPLLRATSKHQPQHPHTDSGNTTPEARTPTPRAAEDPSATPPNTRHLGHQQTEATSQATLDC